MLLDPNSHALVLAKYLNLFTCWFLFEAPMENILSYSLAVRDSHPFLLKNGSKVSRSNIACFALKQAETN